MDARELWRRAVEARARTGKRISDQLREIVQLRLTGTRLGASEYYLYGLSDGRVTPAGRKEFVGWRAEAAIDRALNLPTWRAIANDKLLFYQLMSAMDVHFPRIDAVYLPGTRTFPGASVLRDRASLVQYLEDPGHYPFFCKPVHGTYGRGAMAALEVDVERRRLILPAGGHRAIDAVLDDLDSAWAEGFIFSELLEPHSEIARLCGPRLSSVRVIVLLQDDGPRIWRAVWKIPVGDNISDNFMHGETGNLLGAVDAQTGGVERVVEARQLGVGEASMHPDTRQRLPGQRLPCWDQVRELCLRCAAALPGLRMQHWDIALCPQGPVALEVNVEGSFDLHQLASGRGIYEPRLRALIPRLW